MSQSHPAPEKVRFGPFELDRESGELLKDGTRIKLQDQPFQILCILLEQPGRVVTREELKNRVWPADTFVEFDQGLYSAIRRLRDALSDSADTPRYIETLARRGYRFMSPIDGVAAPTVSSGGSPVAASRTPWFRTAITVVAVLVIAGLLWFKLRPLRGRAPVDDASGIRSLVVLPLENLSRDPEQEYFADGMTDELITDLARIRDLRVISRTSAMHYKGSQKTLPQIARELNVDAVVEGTVARDADRVRIRVQLIRASDDRHLWAQAYDRDLRDVLMLQSDAARDIAANISITLNPSSVSPGTARSHPIKPEAYETYLKGRYFWAKRTREGTDKAISYFLRAVEQDPNCAPAYSGLADAYMDFAFEGGPQEPTTGRAKAAARKAVEIDPSSAEAHISMAQVFEYYDRSWSEAEKEYRRGLELNPNYATGHQIYSVFLAGQGRFSEATAEAQSAQHLDPVSPFVYRTGGLVSFFARQDEQSFEQCRKALEIDPNFRSAHNCLFDLYYQQGSYEQAVHEFETLATSSDIKPATVATLTKAFRTSGMKGFWRKQLELDGQGVDVGLDDDFFRAEVYSRLGEESKALDQLEQASHANSAWLEFLNVDPVWDGLRSDRQFKDLVRRVGLKH